MSTIRRFFLAEAPDVLGLLRRQAEVTHGGMRSFARWSETGAEADALAVRTAEHDADDARTELLGALSEALVTPVEQEDLYAISERLDRVLNEAKDTVREAEALGWAPDTHAAAMGVLAREGVDHLDRGVGELGRKGLDPSAHANAATKAARQIEKAYRQALAEIAPDADVRRTVIDYELYRRYPAVAQLIDRAADRLRYVVLKAK